MNISADVTLRRGEEGDWGTKGYWIALASGWHCDTLELPNRGNMPGISRIPPGTYSCSIVWSHHFQQMLYQVNDVIGRGGIEIHRGNWAGDQARGMKADIRGCCLLGRGYGYLSEHPNQLAILNSGIVVAEFMKEMAARPFTLEIIPAQNAPTSKEVQ